MCTYYYLKRLLHEQQLVDERREVHLVRAQDREEFCLRLGVGLLVVSIAAALEARVVDVVVQGVVVQTASCTASSVSISKASDFEVPSRAA